MTHLHISVPAITRGTLARTHELKMSVFFRFLAKSSLHHRSNLTLVSNVCQAALISLFWALTDSTNYWECIIFEFPLILIGKQTMEFLTDQSWSAVKSCYTGGAQNKDFNAVLQMDLTRELFCLQHGRLHQEKTSYL